MATTIYPVTNTTTGSLSVVAGPNITVNQNNNTFTITGSAGGATLVRYVAADVSDAHVWNLWETSGSFLNTGVSSSLVLTKIGSFTSGVLGYLGSGSADFQGDGTARLETVGAAQERTSGQPWTISFWYRGHKQSTSRQRLLCKGTNGGTTAPSFIIEANSAQSFTLEFHNGGYNSVSFTSRTVTTDGCWHHVGATYDGATVLLYFDGDLVAQGSYANVAFPTGEWTINSLPSNWLAQPGYYTITDIRIAYTVRAASYFTNIYSKYAMF